MATKRVIIIAIPELDGNNGKNIDYSTKTPERCRLTLETDKAYRGGVDCTAQVSWIGPRGFGSYALGIGGGGDFSKRYALIPGAATQNKIDKLHAQTFTPEMVAAIVTEVKAYYGFSATKPEEWSGSPDPSDPDNFWIDDATGERVNAKTGERTDAA